MYEDGHPGRFVFSNEELRLVRSLLVDDAGDMPDEALAEALNRAFENLSLDDVGQFFQSIDWNSALGTATPAAGLGGTIGGAIGSAVGAVGGGVGAIPGGLIGAAIGTGVGALAGGAVGVLSSPKKPAAPAPAAGKPAQPSPASPARPPRRVTPAAPARRPAAPAPARPPVRRGPVDAPPKRVPTRTPDAPAKAPPQQKVGGASDASAVIGQIGGVATNVLGTASGFLLSLLQNPEVVKALAQVATSAITSSGDEPKPTVPPAKKEVLVGPEQVPVSNVAVLNLVRTLAERAIDEAARAGAPAEPPAYLQEADGSVLPEMADRDQRAARLERVFREAREPIGIRGLREDIVQRVDGHDDRLTSFRTEVTDTRVFPHAAVCQLKIRIPRRSGAWFTATGFHIAPDLVLTAAHNVVNRRYGQAAQVIVMPGRNGNALPFGAADVRSAGVAVHPAWHRYPDRADYDMALLHVGGQLAAARFFAVAPLLQSARIAVCGYSGEREKGADPDRQNCDFDVVRTVGPATLSYSLHTTKGASGAPVYALLDGHAVAVAVHSRNVDEVLNEGSRVTDDTVAWLEDAAARLRATGARRRERIRALEVAR